MVSHTGNHNHSSGSPRRLRCRPVVLRRVLELATVRHQNENLMASIEIMMAPPNAATIVRMPGTSKVRPDLSGGVKSSPFLTIFLY